MYKYIAQCCKIYLRLYILKIIFAFLLLLLRKLHVLYILLDLKYQLISD
jgi:hypothetical protein